MKIGLIDCDHTGYPEAITIKVKKDESNTIPW